MRSLPWLILAGLAAVLVYQFWPAIGPVRELTGDDFARLVYLGAIGLVLAAGMFGSGLGFSGAARSIAIWLLILLTLVGGYQYRYELQDMASRLTAGLVPGSPISVMDEEGRVSVALDRSGDGHFTVLGEVNGAPLRFMVDTGATTTVLTHADAREAGYAVEDLSFTQPVMTANGQALAARIVADELRVGAISRTRLPVLVAQEGRLGQSLLGMSFLSTLSGIDIRGDRMVLID